MQKKKSLGQHFLRAPSYLSAVADAGSVAAGDTVLEVGPGDGALTAGLLQRGARVVAVEKDRRLIPVLAEKFDTEIKSGQLTLVEQDVLEFEPGDCAPLSATYKLIGNIPYYITGALLKKFLSGPHKPSRLVFLVQKEVAERIALPAGRQGAHKNKESILSLSVKAYGSPTYIKTVPRGAFAPPPGVDSAILRVEVAPRFTSHAQEEQFFALIRAGFGQKRKLLRNNLVPLLGEHTSAALERAGIALNARAEDVSLAQWLLLSR